MHGRGSSPITSAAGPLTTTINTATAKGLRELVAEAVVERK